MKVLSQRSPVVSPEIRAPVREKALPQGEGLEVLKTGTAPSRNFPGQKAQNNKEINPDELKRLAEQIQKKFDFFSKYLKIEIDHDLDIPVVKIVDKQTNQVVRQIPPEYLLKLMKNLDQMLGILVNQKV